MTDRAEARHVDADLGHHRCGDDVADARDLRQSVGGSTKRPEAFAHLIVDPTDRLLQRISLVEMQPEQEAVVARDLAAQCLDDLRARRLHARGDACDQLLRVGLARYERGEDRSPAL